MKVITVSSPGKIILFGEHSVVYDKKGVASAIEKRSTVKIKENNGDFITLFLKDYGVKTRTTMEEAIILADEVRRKVENKQFDTIKKLSKNPANPVKTVIGNALKECKKANNFDLIISSKIPRTGGLGSGSSVFAGTSAAVFSLFKKNMSKKRIAENAYWGDVIAHAGTPSGIDTSTVTYGGFIIYKKSEGVKPLKVKNNFFIVIGDTGIPARTKTAVTQVRRMLEKQKNKTRVVLDEMNSVAEEGIRQIKKGDIGEIGELMNKNQELLRKLKVSHQSLEGLIKASLKAGALGAKLSGGGKGGIMIALAENETKQKRIAENIKKAGGKAIITSIGVKGVMVK